MKKLIVSTAALALLTLSSMASAASISILSGGTDFDTSPGAVLVTHGLNHVTTSHGYTMGVGSDMDVVFDLTENLTPTNIGTDADFASMTLSIADGATTLYSWTTAPSLAGFYDSIVETVGLAAGVVYTVTVAGTFFAPPTTGSYNLAMSAVPVPAALLLFGPALLGMMAMSRRNRKAALSAAA